MTRTLVLPDLIGNSLSEQAKLPRETAGILLARLHRAENGDHRLLGRSIHWLPSEAYRVRTATELSITSAGYVEPLRYAEEDGAVPIWVHTHPKGNPVPSARDKRVDAEVGDVFRIRSGSEFYGTLIASPSEEGIALTGTLQSPASGVAQIDRFWFVGDRWRLVAAFGRHQVQTDGMFDRNIRAFGAAIQRTIGDLRIAVIGAGGTGSAVAEQLVRMGARQLQVVDSKTLSESNVTRVYGSTESQVGRHKADNLCQHLRQIAPATCCESIHGRCTMESVARRLANVDLIFGCTDDNAGRLVLSRLSTYYLIPVIDVGVLLSSGANGVITGIDGRVTTLSPNDACLVCRGRIDLARAAAEQRPPEERRRLVEEGYAPALGPVEPAVVPFTSMVAAVGVGELLERLVGYGHRNRPSEVLLRIHDREISTNVATPTPRHYCHPDAGKQGIGDTEPFLEQIWSE